MVHVLKCAHLFDLARFEDVGAFGLLHLLRDVVFAHRVIDLYVFHARFTADFDLLVRIRVLRFSDSLYSTLASAGLSWPGKILPIR